MLIYDVSNRERVFDIVTNSLRNLGVKPRIKRNSKKKDSIDKYGVHSQKIFNVPLSHQLLDGVQLSSGAVVNVPIFIKQAIIYLNKYINEEGLFRKAGSQTRQKDLVNRLDNGNGLGEKYHGIDVANCLKKYFRDLPEPIIPYAYHDLFVRCGMLKIAKVEAILLACLLLPSMHLNTLAVFMDFLKKVSLHESQNKMAADNLAKVIGPNIMPLRETTMSAMQTRLETHLKIIKILIENARSIGVLPKNITDMIRNDLYHNTEIETDRISDDRLKEKKKKHRSGSLTRMFNGLKKIVVKNGSPDVNTSMNENQLKVSTQDLSFSPCKVPMKRKIEFSIPLANIKKKRNSDALSTITTLIPPKCSLSPISKRPYLVDKIPTLHKSRIRKYIPHSVQTDAVNQKIDKSKILGSHIDRFMSRSRQKINNLEMENDNENERESLIERRWSATSSTRTPLKKRKTQNWSASSLTASPSIKREQVLFSKNTSECYDCVFMDADVNLSDENMECYCTESIGRRSRKSLRHGTILNNLNNTSLNCDNEKSNENDDMKNEEYMKIPKSEYEEIKNLVSVIESRISQEFSSIVDQNITDKLPIHVASEVQSEYEKTLDEASIGSIVSTDHLARRLSKELKIRRSAEDKVIRSPSARRIGNLRRRSQEKSMSPRKRVSRTSSWQVSEKFETNSSIMSTGLQSNKNNINSYCCDATNARLNYLQRQLCTLISHTAKHAGSLSSDDENSQFVINPSASIIGVRRASSFHDGEQSDDSHYYNTRISGLRKTNSQQNIARGSEERIHDPRISEIRKKILSWKDASAYLEFETPSKSTLTPTTMQACRASIAKLRTQNAGMVLAKAKLFDYNGSKNGQESYKVRGEQRQLKESRIIMPTEIIRKKKCKSPKFNGVRSKMLQSPSDSILDRENRRMTKKVSCPPCDNLIKSTDVKSMNLSSQINATTLSVMINETNRIDRFAEHENMTSRDLINTPHIKKPLSMKTPKSARSLARRPPIDTGRTPLKAVSTLISTPKRHSPKTTLRSRQTTRNINID